MITLTSLLHRGELRDIIRRWMYGNVLPDDAARVSRLVSFNMIFIPRYLGALATDLFGRLHGSQISSRGISHKGALKDVLIANPPYRSRRIDEMILNYRSNPERYYRETPCQATLYFSRREDRNLFIGSSRVKRLRRIAEKAARRIIDGIYLAIKKQAEVYADSRANALGIPRENLLTTPEDMLAEFVRAEVRIQEDLRSGRAIRDLGEMFIDDVAGLKVILEDGDHDRLIKALSDTCECEILERETHRGNYNATNLIVRHVPPKERIVARPISAAAMQAMADRGMDPRQVEKEFLEFVNTGEDGVNLEIIISNYEETLEGEIGRCMHEDRIIEQRMKEQYRGWLARNTEYLMVYLFNIAASRQTKINEVPIKLWNRYLPDYFEEVMRQLFEVPPHFVDD
ncbi:MAG TPA: hypothetical protein PLB96_14875 [Syntrophales bacterium]|nr:hypothetical protein [Syntrophales bacterium]